MQPPPSDTQASSANRGTQYGSLFDFLPPPTKFPNLKEDEQPKKHYNPTAVMVASAYNSFNIVKKSSKLDQMKKLQESITHPRRSYNNNKPSRSLAGGLEDTDKKIITHFSVMKDRSVSLKPKFNANKSNLEDNYNENSRIFSHFQKRMNDMSKPTLQPLEHEQASRASSSHLGSIIAKS